MSVCLLTLKGGEDCDDIEIMAPDYDQEYIWLWDEPAENRLDFSRDQLRELRDFLNALLGYEVMEER